MSMDSLKKLHSTSSEGSLQRGDAAGEGVAEDGEKGVGALE